MTEGVSDTVEVQTTAKTERIGTTAEPLMFGAFRTGQGRTQLAGKYNGKIESPHLANRALTQTEMGTLKHTPESPQLSSVIVGAWDFSRDIPLVKVSDTSPNVLHGTIVDMPARDAKWYNWTGLAGQ